MSSDLVQKLRDGNTLDIGEAADRIESLEAEVGRLRTESAEHLQFWKNNAEACAEAEARAERLRVALEEAVAWMNGCAVSGGYPAWHAKAIKAIEDDKQ